MGPGAPYLEPGEAELLKPVMEDDEEGGELRARKSDV